MSAHWLRTVFPITLLYACRMLGLFLLIPVFTLYAPELNHATPELIGLALGAYGLSQACMQIPFGLLSDRFGRKPMIIFGLGLLIIGSLIGALTHSIYGMLFARILQGAGAIGSVLLALVGDLIPAHHRAKAMAVVGVSIGVSFSIAMILGPVLTSHFGLSSLFYLTAGLATLGVGILFYAIPTPITTLHTAPFQLSAFRKQLTQPELQQLNIGIFVQHAVLTATFYVLPLQLHQFITTSWHFYLPIVFFSFICMAPIVAISEKKQCVQPVLKLAVFILIVTQALLTHYSSSWPMLVTLIFIYFIAFNLGEAFLPSQISQQAPATQRGTAMGIYSTYQFMGIFAGGALAGLTYAHWGSSGVFSLNTLMCVGWFLMMSKHARVT
ncbi:MAG: MFS transporter [Gammaproteobacteria bacterium]|nr:MFS transporter [Gammaproteobacteria bacterium]